MHDTDRYMLLAFAEENGRSFVGLEEWIVGSPLHEMRLQEAGTVALRVKDAAGTDVEGVHIFVLDETGHCVLPAEISRDKNVYVIGDIPAENLQLYAYLPSESIAGFAGIRVAPASTSFAELRLSPAGKVLVQDNREHEMRLMRLAGQAGHSLSVGSGWEVYLPIGSYQVSEANGSQRKPGQTVVVIAGKSSVVVPE
jgi:hypothetical protein